MQTTTLFPELEAFVQRRSAFFDEILAGRKRTLEQVAAFIRDREAVGQETSLTFICTHNSRRSHMSQLWAQAAAFRAGHGYVKMFSGGTEATALNHRAVAALQRAGFEIDAPAGGEDNPRYQVRYAEETPPLAAFSKRYKESPNPARGFVAVMTCDQADVACPIVSGAAMRVSLPYVDPKASDGTDGETATYDARSAQIATEMAYLVSQI